MCKIFLWLCRRTQKDTADVVSSGLSLTLSIYLKIHYSVASLFTSMDNSSDTTVYNS